MNAPAALYTIQWLIRDTFRQARASGIFYLMSGITVLCMAVCLTIRIHEAPKLPLVGKERPEALPATYVPQAAAVARHRSASALTVPAPCRRPSAAGRPRAHSPTRSILPSAPRPSRSRASGAASR